MELNTSNIRSLASLSDGEFSKMVYSIALAMGFSHEKAVEASHNTAFFRILLSNASDSELRSLLGKVDGNKLNEIYGNIAGKK